MAKVPYTTVWTDMYPTAHQSAQMNELAASTYDTYCWTLDGLAAGRWDVNNENFTEVYNGSIRQAWHDARPDTLCPIVMMKYVHREACHNWIDNGKDPSLVPAQKAAHANLFYMPASGHFIKDGHVGISAVGRVRVAPCELPGRMYVIIGHKIDDHWKAEIRTALQ